MSNRNRNWEKRNKNPVRRTGLLGKMVPYAVGAIVGSALTFSAGYYVARTSNTSLTFNNQFDFNYDGIPDIFIQFKGSSWPIHFGSAVLLLSIKKGNDVIYVPENLDFNS